MWGRHCHRGSFGLAATIVALAVIPGCTSDKPEPDPSGPALLSAAEVGGSELSDVESIITASSPCPLDGAKQWTGADASNTNAYRRTLDGVSEVVVIGAVERSRSSALDALRSLRQRIGAPRCVAGASDPPGDTWKTAPLEGFGGHTVAFRSQWNMAGPAASDDDAAAAGRHSFLRAYRYVAGHLVLVWLERHGDTDPSVADLRELLTAQSEALDSTG